MGNTKLYILSKGNLDMFFAKFAIAKLLSTESKNIERRDSQYVWWDSGVTSIGVTNFKFDSPKFKSWVKSEVKILWERYCQVIQRASKNKENPMEVSKQWIDNHKKFLIDYHKNYSTRINELNAINQQMINRLGFSIIAGSVAQASAEIALILTGVGLPVGGCIIRKVIAENTIKTALKKFAVGFVSGSTIGVIEDWQKAAQADVLLITTTQTSTNYLTNFQGYYDDNLGVVINQNNAKIDLLEKELKALKASGKLGREYSKVSDVLGPKQAALGMHNYHLGMVKSGIKGVGYFLAFKGTYDSLIKLEKHCRYEI